MEGWVEEVCISADPLTLWEKQSDFFDLGSKTRSGMTVVTLLRPEIACDDILEVLETWNDTDDDFFLRIHLNSRTSQAAVQFSAFAVRLDCLLDRHGTVKLAVNLYDCENC